MRVYGKHKGQYIHHKILKILKRISKTRMENHCLKTRSQIILLAVKGFTDIEIASELCIHANRVMVWRNRFFDALSFLERIACKMP